MDTKKIKVSYFVIPAIILCLSWLDGWFAISNLDWVQKLRTAHILHLGWIFALWHMVFLCNAIAATLFWNEYPRNDLFKTVVSLTGVNVFCFVVSHYLFYMAHSIGASLVFFIGSAISLWYVIYLLWPKVRLIAALLLPYGISVVYGLYLVHAVWLLN